MDIEPEQLDLVKSILGRHIPNRTVWAFGSRIKGCAKPYSDLDLAVIGNEPLSLAEHAELVDAFSESDLPWKVDIADWQLISPEFRKIIQQNYAVFQTALK